MKKKRRRRLYLLLTIFIITIISVRYFEHQKKLRNTPMPDAIHPIVAESKERLIEQAKEQGISILIYEDFRTVEEQDELYRKGRSSEGNVVTYAEGGESYHNYGLAIDFAIEPSPGQAIWDLEYDGNGNGVSDWLEVVDIAKGLGFTWGGDWKDFKDYPHLQMDFGLSIKELQRGERPDTIENT